MKCDKCNYSNPDNSAFCSECGTKIISGSNKSPSNKGWGWGLAWVLSILIFFFILIGAESASSDTSSLFLLIDVIFGIVAFILMIFYAASNTSSSKSKITKPVIHNSKNTKTDSKYSRLLDEELSDVIFKPKKKSNNAAIWIIGTLGAILVLFLFLSAMSSTSETYETETTSISDESTNDTFEEFPDYLLTLENTDSEWSGQQLYIKGTIKNSHSELATNVKIRVDFSKNADGTGLFDTRYITILAVPAMGAYSFSEPVYINTPPTDKWWWSTQIIGAE